MQQFRLIPTDDHSMSLFNEYLNESYHSQFGAISESMLVFIEYGLRYAQTKKEPIHLIEYGFGTGLNALLTMANADGWPIHYRALELYPPGWEIIQDLNYIQNENLRDYSAAFKTMHTCEWDEIHQIYPSFNFIKHQTDFLQYKAEPNSVDLIYFDAFSPDKQPELWTETLFEQAYVSLRNGGVLVTYSSKGLVKRALRNVGFVIQRLKGPLGKRHVLRALKQ